MGSSQDGLELSVDLRCPEGPQRLFAKLQPSKVTAVNGLIELACSDCARARRKNGIAVVRVLHRFNLLGELVESVEVMR